MPNPDALIEAHAPLLAKARAAARSRTYFAAFAESPSTRIWGEAAPIDAEPYRRLERGLVDGRLFGRARQESRCACRALEAKHGAARQARDEKGSARDLDIKAEPKRLIHGSPCGTPERRRP